MDIGTKYNIKYNINENTTPLMCSDILTIAKPEFINIEQNIGKEHFPFTPQVFFDLDYNIKPEISNKYANYSKEHGNEFLQNIWIFMPELNYRLYVLEHNLQFIEGWHQGGTSDFPYNYGFRAIRD